MHIFVIGIILAPRGSSMDRAPMVQGAVCACNGQLAPAAQSFSLNFGQNEIIGGRLIPVILSSSMALLLHGSGSNLPRSPRGHGPHLSGGGMTAFALEPARTRHWATEERVHGLCKAPCCPPQS